MATAKTKTKAKPAKKPAAKKPAAKKPAVKKPAAKKLAAKKPPKAAPAKAGSGERSDVEQQVATMLREFDDGSIDNAFDVINDAYELDKQLPKTSSLRPAFDKMYRELGEICAESAAGDY